MANLYELTADYQALLVMAEDPETDPQAIKDTLEGLEGEIEDKADAYARVIAELKGKMQMIDAEIARLQKMSDSIENNIDTIKKNLQKCMTVTGKTKFKTSLFSFWIQKNQAALKIDDESKIPLEYWIPQPAKVDNEAIKKLIKDGNELDYAHLEQSESIRIR